MLQRTSFFMVLALGAGVTAIACSTTDVADSEVSEDEIRRFNPARSDGGEGLPSSSSIGGFSLGSYEYWPYGAVAEGESPYPDHIQWGFSAGGDKARLCMAESRRALAGILADPPAELLRLKTEKGISSFFSWNNDMTGAPAGVTPAFPKLWLYESSLIKWISETNRDGTCKIPTRRDLVTFSNKCLRTYPDC